jgi:hypothetical protein
MGFAEDGEVTRAAMKKAAGRFALTAASKEDEENKVARA